MLVVSIAGSVPSADVTLGDVVLSTRIHDLTVEARSAGEDPTYSTTGGPVAKALASVRRPRRSRARFCVRGRSSWPFR